MLMHTVQRGLVNILDCWFWGSHSVCVRSEFKLLCVHLLICQVVAMAKSVSFSGYMAVGKDEVSHRIHTCGPTYVTLSAQLVLYA